VGVGTRANELEKSKMVKGVKLKDEHIELGLEIG
jgi:hypothetical protein